MISVVLATSRPSRGAMLAYPGADHLDQTLSFLSGQTHDDFELVVADVLRETPLRDEASLRDGAHFLGRPVYHVPVDSPWVARGYSAISATRNAGFAHSAGEHVVFLDDCSEPPLETLARYARWFSRGRFAQALHVRMRGAEMTGRDSRFAIFEGDGAKRFAYQGFSACGQGLSVSAEALLRVNGFDEALDGSRQLEDGDLSDRLRAAGCVLVLDRELIIPEQEHAAPVARDGQPFRESPRCNGVWIFNRQRERPGEHEANRRDWTAEERVRARPCGYLDRASGHCRVVNAFCNRWTDFATGRHDHDSLGDEWLTAPVFDLAARREECLAGREQYRIA